MAIKPHDYFNTIRPDEVAECWDGVLAVEGLYEALWACVAKYERIESEEPVYGPNAVKLFWADLAPYHADLNRLAEQEDSKWENAR